MYSLHKSDECIFVDDTLMEQLLKQQLVKGARLASLNVGYCDVTNRTLDLLIDFKSLNALHIGGTNIDLFQLMLDVTRGKYSNLATLQKLSLKQMKEIGSKIQNGELRTEVSEYYNDVFSNIVAHFPLLSHLDISISVINRQ